MKLLGAPLRHFGFNRWWAAFFGLGALLLGTGTVVALFGSKEDFDAWMPVVGFACLALLGYVLARTLTSSATVCENGLRYKVLNKQGEMLWDEVEKFRYAILNTYHGFIKTTQYTLTLVDKEGHKAELGSNVEHPKELAALLVDRLHPRLLEKTIAAYESGQILDFGAIKVSRGAMEVKVGLWTVSVPTASVAGCTMNRGMVLIGEKKQNGKVRNHAVFTRQVYNAFALMELVNSRIVQRAAAAAAGR